MLKPITVIFALVLSAFVFASCASEAQPPLPTATATSVPAPPTPQPSTQTSFRVTVENVTTDPTGVYTVGLSDNDSPAIPPGESHTFVIPGGPGQNFTFASMLIPSNDFFYAPDGAGIPLFVNGEPNEGDLTNLIRVWDAGTERNQPLGIGSESPFTGGVGLNTPDTNNQVRFAEDEDLPSVGEIVRLNLEYLGDNLFEVVLSNVSSPDGAFTVLIGGDSGFPPLPPEDGVIPLENQEPTEPVLTEIPAPITVAFWMVHGTENPLFTEGERDRGQGLKLLAEDGSPFELLGFFLGDGTSLPTLDFWVSPFAPGVWAVHSSGSPIFEENSADFGDGLEALAEDGEPSQLAESLSVKPGVASSGVFNTPDGAAGPGPLHGMGTYSFEFSAEEGDNLSFTTMFVQSNDWFIGPVDDGLPLFRNGVPISGEITDEMYLWDAGTEADQLPGLGADQPVRQSGPNIGAAGNGSVTRSPSFDLPSIPGSIQLPPRALVKVTISPAN